MRPGTLIDASIALFVPASLLCCMPIRSVHISFVLFASDVLGWGPRHGGEGRGRGRRGTRGTRASDGYLRRERPNVRTMTRRSGHPSWSRGRRSRSPRAHLTRFVAARSFPEPNAIPRGRASARVRGGGAGP
eukprot:31080-Pelagococcus_subviridis.AAC.8